jgi:ribonuclease R
VGDDFEGLIISITKIGLFVELTDLFVEGLVPIDTLVGDRFAYHENTREIIGLRTHAIYRLGQRVRVVVDRIDSAEKKIQFSLWREPSVANRSPRRK